MDDEALRGSIRDLQLALRLTFTLLLVGGAWMSVEAYLGLKHYSIVFQTMVVGAPLPRWTQAALIWGKLGMPGVALISCTAVAGLAILWGHSKFRIAVYGGFAAAGLLWANYFFIAGAVVSPVRRIIMNLSGG